MTLLMAMVLTTGSLAACGGNSDDSAATAAPQASTAGGEEGSNGGTPTDVSLKVWVPQEDTQGYGEYGENLTEYMINEFNKSQTKWNVKPEIKPVAEGDAYKTVNTDPSKAADVIAAAGDNMVQLIDGGYISPIADTKVEEVKKEENNPSVAIEGATFEDKDLGGKFLYGVPFSPNTWFMYYDKSKYSEEEVKSLETMMAKDLKDTKYNFCMPLDNGWYAPAFFFAAGCNLFGEDGMNPESCDFNSEAGVSAGKYIMDLAHNKKFFMDDNNSVGINYLKDGSLAAWCGGTWNAEQVKKALGENYAATVMPTVKIGDKDVSLQPYSSYKYFVVKANDDAQIAEAAQDLAIWLGGKECQEIRLKAREVAPTWKSVSESSEATGSPAVAACMAQGLTGHPQPGIVQMGNTWDSIKAFVTWAKGKDAKEDGIKGELNKMVENILAEIKK